MASAMAKCAKPAHKRAARLLGFALTLGTEAAWWQFAALIGVILDPKERAALAYMALLSLEPKQSQQVAEAALFNTYRGDAE